MIIDHTRPEYIEARNKIGLNRYNGAYYYSKEIVDIIIPRVKTDRNWITIRAGELGVDHSIVFVHNNLTFEKSYNYLFKYKDLIWVVGLPDMVEQVSKHGKTIYLPLSVDVEYVKEFICDRKDKDTAFIGRRMVKRDFIFPEGTDFVEGLPRDKLLREMSRYRRIYSIGRTAIEGKILGCEVLPFHPRLPDTSLWAIFDSKDAAKLLQEKLNEIED